VPDELASRYDEIRHEFERAGGFSADAELRATLVGLGLGAEKWEQPLAKLSGGWLMRVELAKLLIARPEVLLLDEPTNHLDLPSIRWFEACSLVSRLGDVTTTGLPRPPLQPNRELSASRLTRTGQPPAYVDSGPAPRRGQARGATSTQITGRALRHALGRGQQASQAQAGDQIVAARERELPSEAQHEHARAQVAPLGRGLRLSASAERRQDPPFGRLSCCGDGWRSSG
jgi:hypothetical protein